MIDIHPTGASPGRKERDGRGSLDSPSWQKAKLIILKMVIGGGSMARRQSRTALIPGM